MNLVEEPGHDGRLILVTLLQYGGGYKWFHGAGELRVQSRVVIEPLHRVPEDGSIGALCQITQVTRYFELDDSRACVRDPYVRESPSQLDYLFVSCMRPIVREAQGRKMKNTIFPEDFRRCEGSRTHEPGEIPHGIPYPSIPSLWSGWHNTPSSSVRIEMTELVRHGGIAAHSFARYRWRTPPGSEDLLHPLQSAGKAVDRLTRDGIFEVAQELLACVRLGLPSFLGSVSGKQRRPRPVEIRWLVFTCITDFEQASPGKILYRVHIVVMRVRLVKQLGHRA